MKEVVAVVGLGYVGLPLALSCVKSDFKTIGIDSNLAKIKSLNYKKSYIEDIPEQFVVDAIDSGNFFATDDYSQIKNADIVLLCVPTPLTKKNLPDLSFLENAVKEVSQYLKRGSLVILESTVSSGTTRNYLIPLIEKCTNAKISEFYVAFSPERIDPNSILWNLTNTPKLVSGLTNESRKRAVDFYVNFIDTVIECESLEIAETAKLLENTFRLINISFINEITIFCQKLGIDINQVIKAAATKPYGFMPFYPSIGVGGHCIPVDPLYLANKAREIGAPTRFIDLADQINQEMPGYFVSRAEEKLGELKSKKVIVVGVSYKPNVADVRETPVESLIVGLKQKGAQVSWHDDLVKEWNGEKSVTLSSDFDLAIIATPHDYLDLSKLGNVPILNTRGSI